jgi:hypothetical protein
MGRLPKPVKLLRAHVGRAEIERRERAESELITGEKLREWPQVKENPAAHRHFSRLRQVLSKIGKADALYEAVLNRYALISAEVESFEDAMTSARRDMTAVSALHESGELKTLEYLDRAEAIDRKIISLDRRILAKRRMLLDMERENAMTVISALRSIPKKQEKKAESSMAAFLRNRRTGGDGSDKR